MTLRRILTQIPHFAAMLLVLVTCGPASAQLRIVTYNSATANTMLDIYTARAGMDVVLEAIGDELVGGIAKPIDVLLLQEQDSMAVSGQSIVDILNGIYGAGAYARSSIDGTKSFPTNSGGAPGLVYNTQTIELIQEIQFGPSGRVNLNNLAQRSAINCDRWVTIPPPIFMPTIPTTNRIPAQPTTTADWPKPSRYAPIPTA